MSFISVKRRVRVRGLGIASDIHVDPSRQNAMEVQMVLDTIATAMPTAVSDVRLESVMTGLCALQDEVVMTGLGPETPSTAVISDWQSRAAALSQQIADLAAARPTTSVDLNWSDPNYHPVENPTVALPASGGNTTVAIGPFIWEPNPLVVERPPVVVADPGIDPGVPPPPPDPVPPFPGPDPWVKGDKPAYYGGVLPAYYGADNEGSASSFFPTGATASAGASNGATGGTAGGTTSAETKKTNWLLYGAVAAVAGWLFFAYAEERKWKPQPKSKRRR